MAQALGYPTSQVSSKSELLKFEVGHHMVGPLVLGIGFKSSLFIIKVRYSYIV